MIAAELITVSSASVYDDFLNRVDIIVKEYLSVHSGKECREFSEDKVINDPIWGCVKYYGWEISIIDTPLFQRLRDIYQVGLGLFTYPSARHSRFEHSLGVVAIASRMIESLKQLNLSFIKISENDVVEVRLAALVHDLGHCFGSHLSEAYYGVLPEFVELTRFFNKSFGVRPKAHEIFSYLIINTPSFISFLNSNGILPADLVSSANGYPNLMKRIGNMIIGVPNKGRYNGQEHDKTYSFLSSIINGDIDADKLDYIKRDSYTSGLPLTFDIERLLYKITIKEHKNNNEYQLVVDMSGITAVEEITFSKLMLNNYIYHHQKILATEVMAKDIALALTELKMVCHPSEFLRYTDKTIDALVQREDIPFSNYGCTTISLGYLVKRVKDRYLPKRCFEINSRVLEVSVSEEQDTALRQEYTKQCLANIESTSSTEDKEAILASFAADVFEFNDKSKNHISSYKKFISDFGKKTYSEYTNWIRKDIASKICELYELLSVEFPAKGISTFDVHIVVPKSIDEQMVFTTPIVYRNSDNHTTSDMLSYTKNWAQAFNSNKWSGYVFVSPYINVTIAFKATEIILQEYMHDVIFNNPKEFVKRIDDELLSKIESSYSAPRKI